MAAPNLRAVCLARNYEGVFDALQPYINYVDGLMNPGLMAPRSEAEEAEEEKEEDNG